jgi:hypothetical protein
VSGLHGESFELGGKETEKVDRRHGAQDSTVVSLGVFHR